MELNEYQKQAMKTCLPSSNNIAYMFFNLLGEVGELCEKMNEQLQDPTLCDLIEHLERFGNMAKRIRKEPELSWVGVMVKSIEGFREQFRENTLLLKELGDIEWQLNGLMSVLGVEAETICQQNLDKLASRQERGKIDGDGDNR